MSNKEKKELISMIEPSLYTYFGKVMEHKAHEAIALLPNAIDVQITINENK